MVNAGDLAALVAVFFWAVLVCAVVYVLIRLARLLSEASRTMAEMRSRSDLAFGRVQAAVDRANQQLEATSSVTASLDELNTGMSELAEQVSTLAGLGRAIAAGRPAGPPPSSTASAGRSRSAVTCPSPTRASRRRPGRQAIGAGQPGRTGAHR